MKNKKKQRVCETRCFKKKILNVKVAARVQYRWFILIGQL